MPLEIPLNAEEIDTRSKTDIRNALPGSNPFLPNSVLGALTTANSNRIYDWYTQLDLLQKYLMPDTTEDSFLKRWAAIYGKTILPASQASGTIYATGVLGTTIPINTVYVSTNGLQYTVTISTDVDTVSLTPIAITRAGTVVTVQFSTEPPVAVGQSVTISGADQTDYNGVKAVTAVGTDFLRYAILTTPASPATGTLAATWNIAQLPVLSDEYQNTAEGIEVNLLAGTKLTLQSPIVNIDNDAYVGFTPISGGTDQESSVALRARTLDRIQNPVALFNVAAITEKAKAVPGVTRVFVQPVTPALGQVTIYFMRDNDLSAIPDAGEILAVKNSVLEILPANTAAADVIVAAPTGVVVPFTFTALSPDTSAMRTAVTLNLQQFFAEQPQIGIDISEAQYLTAIQNTIDPETGTPLSTFTLSTPTAPIVISSNELGQLGTVTMP